MKNFIATSTSLRFFIPYFFKNVAKKSVAKCCIMLQKLTFINKTSTFESQKQQIHLIPVETSAIMSCGLKLCM